MSSGFASLEKDWQKVRWWPSRPSQQFPVRSRTSRNTKPTAARQESMKNRPRVGFQTLNGKVKASTLGMRSPSRVSEVRLKKTYDIYFTKKNFLPSDFQNYHSTTQIRTQVILLDSLAHWSCASVFSFINDVNFEGLIFQRFHSTTGRTVWGQYAIYIYFIPDIFISLLLLLPVDLLSAQSFVNRGGAIFIVSQM